MNCIRIACTSASATGSPNSSTTRPASTLPRGSAKSALSITCASASSIGLPDSNGRVCPNCIDTKPDFEALRVKRPDGQVAELVAPLRVGQRRLDPMSGPLMRTCARRTGVPVSLATTRPRTRPVPVFGLPSGRQHLHGPAVARTDDLDLLADFLLRSRRGGGCQREQAHEKHERRSSHK